MKQTILAATLAIGCGPASAGPDSTTNALMTDSASMLDFGMLRLNLLLSSKDLGWASFLWDENRIKIHPPTDMLFYNHTSVEEVESRCVQWIDEARTALGVNPETGLVSYGDTTVASSLFSHYGYERTSASETLYNDLDRLMVLNCVGFQDGTAVTVSGALVSKSHSVSKE